MIHKIDGPKPWEVRGWESGKQYRRRFSTKKAAEQFELEVKKREERRRNGLPEERGAINYEDLTKLFLAQIGSRSKNWREEMLRYSISQFGDTPVRALLPDRIGVWLHALPQGEKTKRHIRDAMRQVLDAGVEWGYLARNPVRSRSVRAPRVPDPDVRPFASWTEVEAVAGNAGKYGPLVRFACATGLRPEEWIALQWFDVDFANRLVTVNKVCVDGVIYTDRGKTDTAFRTVLLQKQALDALRSLPRPLDSSALVFPAPKGGHLNLDNWRRRVWKEALEKTGLPYRPLYQCRHTYATLALSAGADLYWISKQLGHRDIRTTLKHYARFQPVVDSRNLRLLDSFTEEAEPEVSETGHLGG